MLDSHPHTPPQEPKLTRATLVCTGILIAIAAVLFGGVLVAGKMYPAVRENLPTVLACTVVVLGLANLVAELLILRQFRIPLSTVGLSRPSLRVLHVLWQIPLAIIVLLIVQGAVFLLFAGNNGTGGGSSFSDLSPVGAVLAFVGLAILTPLWEEIYFRGLVFAAVGQKHSTILAVVVSALLFGAAHLVPILLPYLVTLGFILALLRVFHRNLWGGVALHVTVNTIASASILAVLAP